MGNFQRNFAVDFFTDSNPEKANDSWQERWDCTTSKDVIDLIEPYLLGAWKDKGIAKITIEVGQDNYTTGPDKWEKVKDKKGFDSKSFFKEHDENENPKVIVNHITRSKN